MIFEWDLWFCEFVCLLCLGICFLGQIVKITFFWRIEELKTQTILIIENFS